MCYEFLKNEYMNNLKLGEKGGLESRTQLRVTGNNPVNLPSFGTTKDC